MGNTTVVALDHDRYEEIERDPAGFARLLIDRMRAGDPGRERIPGGEIVTTFHRGDTRDSHDFDAFLGAVRGRQRAWLAAAREIAGAQEMAPTAEHLRAEFTAAVAAELARAYAEHSAEPWSRHEFYGILTEEYEELWDAIKADEPQERVIAELVQVAAMCFRYYETGDRTRGRHPRP